ncbi:MAG: hypothetical protein FJW14_00465 [Acidimicrobiia bacterium]|nr:hypothetical protein [Acidimicrobiia bacterium]
MSIFLLQIPVQLSDSFTEFTNIAGRSLLEVVSAEFQNGSYFRPLRRGLIKVVVDLSGGNYHLAFRGFQAAQVVVLLLLAVRMLRVQSRAGIVALPLALAILVGIHTFAGVVLEGFPINHFLTVLVCCAAAVNLAQARPRALVDAAAAVVLVAAMLTIESGLLVWVLFVAARAVGCRGVSRHGLIVLTACVALYFVGRFVVLGGSAPGLTERSAGFGFSALDPDELVARFGSNPAPFHLYNFVSAISCVLFAEPRGGVWAFVRNLTSGIPEAWQVVNVITSTATTLLIGRYTALRFSSWRAGAFNDADRFVVLFLVMLPANALFAAAYEKDVIMSPAGLFYAAAAYMVVREMTAAEASPRVTPLIVAPVLVLVIAVGWTVRFVGIHDSLRARAMSVRDEWAYYDDWAREQPTDTSLDAPQAAIKQQLFEDAVLRAPRVPQLSLGAIGALFDRTQ